MLWVLYTAFELQWSEYCSKIIFNTLSLEYTYYICKNFHKAVLYLFLRGYGSLRGSK